MPMARQRRGLIWPPVGAGGATFPEGRCAGRGYGTPPLCYNGGSGKE